jgi:hypothetical protein
VKRVAATIAIFRAYIAETSRSATFALWSFLGLVNLTKPKGRIQSGDFFYARFQNRFLRFGACGVRFGAQRRASFGNRDRSRHFHSAAERGDIGCVGVALPPLAPFLRTASSLAPHQVPGLPCAPRLRGLNQSFGASVLHCNGMRASGIIARKRGGRSRWAPRVFVNITALV